MKAAAFVAKHGPDTFRTEYEMQKALCKWLDREAAKIVQSRFFSIPNAAKRSFSEAAMHKATGMKSGALDLYFWRDGGRSMWLELKLPKGRLSDSQLAMIESLHRDGHMACTAWSIATAKEMILEFYA